MSDLQAEDDEKLGEEVCPALKCYSQSKQGVVEDGQIDFIKGLVFLIL